MPHVTSPVANGEDRLVEGQCYSGFEMRALAYLLPVAAVVGCEAEHRLQVEIRSDLAAGYEAVAAEVRLDDIRPRALPQSTVCR